MIAGCIFDESLSGESMALHVFKTPNSRFLNNLLWRLACDAMMQPLCDYACSAWYPSLRKDTQKNTIGFSQ